MLDTHILLWTTREPGRLSETASVAIESRDNQVFVSVASFWEIGIKVGLGKLNFPLEELAARVRLSGFDTLAILPAHATAAAGLPQYHGDPFDRMLVAQARMEHLTLVTADAAFWRYDMTLLS